MQIVIFVGALFLVVIVTAVITAYFVRKKEEDRLGIYQDKILKTQREEVQNIYKTMRGWRHDYHCKAKVPERLTVSDIDLCVILGNLIDNGVESCEKMKETEKKFIRVYIGIFKEQLYISVTNSTNEVIRRLDKEFISNKRGNHGHGLKRIDNIVEKYDGFINRKNEPGAFATEIMLPL